MIKNTFSLKFIMAIVCLLAFNIINANTLKGDEKTVDSLKEVIRLYEDSLNVQNEKLNGFKTNLNIIGEDKLKSTESQQSPMDLKTVITIFGFIYTVFLGFMGWIILRQSNITNDHIKYQNTVISTFEKELDKHKEQLDQIVSMHKDAETSLIDYSEYFVIWFNKILSEKDKYDITQLRYILELMSADENRRFNAIAVLGEIGDNNAIPHLEWIAKNRTRWTSNAEAAILDIKMRLKHTNQEST